jgi:hypothetical protein
MNMQKLLEPYAEGGARTVEGIMKWLLGKGVPQQHIDQAIISVFHEMESGKTFPGGHELDRYILEVANNFHKSELSDNAKKLEEFFNAFVTKKRPLWDRVKAVFGK